MKWIIFVKGVIRTPQTDEVIARLEPRFKKAGFVGRVTSVKRDKYKQLKTIQYYAKRRKIITEGVTLNFVDTIMYKGRKVPYWQLVWSKLLTAGLIINPPIRAEVLTDYIRDGVNKKGQMINPTQHSTGDFFDIGGRVIVGQNMDKRPMYRNRLKAVYAILKQAQADGLGIRKTSSSPLIEHGNNCVHSMIE